ncbi:MAG: hypothetical protein IIY51_01120 [Erysipelotrichaceae bacterium]|nr:hypothetical protein [Erysipelotrichaceae bacterium]
MSEKKGLIHSLEKFVFLVKRRIKKAKLKASGKPQYTVSQLKIFQQLQPGDLILGKMPMSDRKLYEVPDGHRHRPYLVLRKNKKTVTCLQGSHKQYSDDKETFKTTIPDFGQYEGVSYFSTLEYYELPIENINKLIGSLSETQKQALERKLLIMESASRHVTHLDNMDQVIRIGDIIRSRNTLYLITNDRDNIPKGYALSEKKIRNSFNVTVDNVQYYTDLHDYKIFNPAEIQLTGAIPKEKINDLRRFISNGAFVGVGDIINVKNQYYYVFKTVKNEVHAYPLNTKQTVNTIKVNFHNKEFYLNPRKIVRFSDLRRDVVVYSANEKMRKYININRKKIAVEEKKKAL